MLKVVEHSNNELLIEAALDGNINEVHQLLTSDVSVNFHRPTDGKTALHEAAKAGHVEIIKLLLDSVIKHC